MTMRGRAASWARSQALRLLQREPSDEHFDAVGGRYMGFKALGLLTVAASRESIAAFASALNDSSDAIRFGAGELLVATLPRISIGARCSLKEHAAEAHTPPDAACESYMLKHDEEAVRRRSPMGFHSEGFNAASDSIQSWQLGVSAILRQFASRDTYTRFAAGVALRRVAAGCATGHVVGGSILARVEAALVGQHTMRSTQLSHAAKSVAAALSQCELIGRTKPQRIETLPPCPAFFASCRPRRRARRRVRPRGRSSADRERPGARAGGGENTGRYVQPTSNAKS